MAEVIKSGNGSISLGSVHGEEDLKPHPGININPPPADDRCDCCGRPISQLKPFGKTEAPFFLVDCERAYLMRTRRPYGPKDKEALKAWDEAVDSSDNGEGDPEDILIAKYGEKKGQELICRLQICTETVSSWECRDCIILTKAQYFARLWAWTW